MRYFALLPNIILELLEIFSLSVTVSIIIGDEFKLVRPWHKKQYGMFWGVYGYVFLYFVLCMGESMPVGKITYTRLNELTLHFRETQHN